MSKELLTMAELVSNEKELDIEAVFTALEDALAAAVRKRFHEEQVEIKVRIDQHTGDYKTWRIWHIVDDDEILENPATQMRECVAEIEFPDAELNIGDVYEQEIPNEDFGRISAQNAKNIIIQKLREAERNKVFNMFSGREGELVYGVILRSERGRIIVDINGIEATIDRRDSIARENLRNGERVLCAIKKVNADMKLPQLELSRSSSEFLIALFRKEVPEISSGAVEIMAAAREAGLRSKIAVRALDTKTDPVGACIGIRGARIGVVQNELAGETIDIVVWDEDPEVFIKNAMSPAPVVNTHIESNNKTIDLAVPQDKLGRAVGREGLNVRLASELTGWSINVLSEEEFSKKREAAQIAKEENLAQALEIEQETAAKLIEAGYENIEEIAYADRDELVNEENFAEELADTILEAASNALLKQAFDSEAEEETVDEMQVSVANLDNLSAELAEKLIAAEVNTRENLAELSVDELMKIGNLNEEQAKEIILQAREPWFRQ